MNNLRELRERMGMKQTALARELNVKNQASISEWETGRKGLSLENAILFAEYFGVSVGCVAGTEPIPEGYPTSNIKPIQRPEPIEPREPIQNIEPIEPLRVAEPQKSFRRKAPFSQEQMDYLEEWGDRLAERIAGTLREDSSSSGEKAK